MNPTQRLAALFVVVAALASTVPTAAQTRPDCRTPRAAALTWLSNLPPSGDSPRVAATCFAWEEEGIPPGERATYARQLKEIFDQRGWLVPVDSFPDVAEVADEDLEDGRIRLGPRVSLRVYLERQGDRWLIAGDGLTTVPAVHAETFALDLTEWISELPSWTRASFLGVALWQIAGLFLAILLGLFVRLLVARVLVGQAARVLRRKSNEAWDTKVLRRAANPIGTLVLTGVLWWSLPLLRFSVRVNAISAIALRVMAASATVLLLYRLVDFLAHLLAKRAEKTETKFDDQIVPLIRKSLKVFVAVVGVIFVLQNLDVDVGSLLAGVSLGGLAFTLAAKDTVANLFGSISIFADQPFQIGDWVVINGHEGIVDEVGMRSTRIRTFYDSVVTLPNSKVADAAIDNYGRRRFRRQMFTVGITYDSTPEQVQAFVEGIRAILMANDKVRQDLYEVHFRNFGTSSLEVLVYFFVRVASWSDELQQRHHVLMEIMRLAKRVGVDFAFPTQTLHLQTIAESRPIAPRVVPPTDELATAVAGFGPGGAHSSTQTPLLAGGFFADASTSRGSDAEG